MKKIEITGTNTLGGQFVVGYGHGNIAEVEIKIFNDDNQVIFEMAFPKPSDTTKELGLPPLASLPATSL